MGLASPTAQQDAEISLVYNSQLKDLFKIFLVVLILLILLKYVFNMIFGDFDNNFQIIHLRHDKIKSNIFAMTGSSNLNFARTGVCMTIPESHEDQINNLNKISVLKGEKKRKLRPGDLINDDFFSHKGVTKQKYDRIIELIVEAYMNTDGKLSAKDQEEQIKDL